MKVFMASASSDSSIRAGYALPYATLEAAKRGCQQMVDDIEGTPGEWEQGNPFLLREVEWSFGERVLSFWQHISSCEVGEIDNIPHLQLPD